MLRTLYRPFFGILTILFVLLVGGQVLFLFLPYLQGKIIDDLATHAPLSHSFMLGGIILGVYLVANILNYLRERYEQAHLDYGMPQFIATHTLERVFRFSLGQHINEHSGLRLSVVNKGSDALIAFINTSVYSLLPFLLQIILATAAITFVSPLLGGVVLFFSLIYVAAQYRYNTTFLPTMKENRKRWNDQSKYFNEALRNVKVIKLSAKEDAIVREYDTLYEDKAQTSRAIWFDYLSSYYWRTTLIYFGQVFALMVGVYLVSIGAQSPGSIVMLIGWMGSVFGNVGNLGWAQRQMITQFSDIQIYHDALDREPAVKDKAGAVELGSISGRIEFRNVSFAYPIAPAEATPEVSSDDDETAGEGNEEDDVSKEILRDVSFTIEAGETAAIVGHSGAGKTTIVHLLLRGYDPDQGSVLVDGHDLRDVSQQSFLRRVGYVPQQVELFDNALRYNMTFAAAHPETITDAQLDDVSRKARVDQFYDRLGEKRFDVLIGENGVKLSGGERQRVGIARALLQEPDILIFDEATSNLDAENEAIIHEAMGEALKGRTGIIIAHRLSTVRDADRIIVMDGGRMVGVGKHAELVETCEPYRRLVEHQIITV